MFKLQEGRGAWVTVALKNNRLVGRDTSQGNHTTEHEWRPRFTWINRLVLQNMIKIRCLIWAKTYTHSQSTHDDAPLLVKICC